MESASVSNPSLVIYQVITGLICFICKYKIIVESVKFVTSVFFVRFEVLVAVNVYGLTECDFTCCAR